MPSLLILAPFVGIVILNLPFVKGLMRSLSFWLVTALCLFQMGLVLIHPLTFWSIYPDPLGPFFAFRFLVDSLSLVLFFCIGLVVLVSNLVAKATIDDRDRRFNFVNLLLIALIGMNATVMVTDIFSQYVFVEITAVSSFILIALQKDKLALEGAFKYLMLSAIATVLMLTSIGLLLFVSQDTSFAAIYGSLGGPSNYFLPKLAVGLFLCGLFIKSGIVPFHGWVPDAYSSSPNAVSILLAGIITKVSGVYSIARILISAFGFNPSIQNILMFAGALSIIVGAFQAMAQNNFKRLLSYSSISQVGYIILGIGCATPLAIAGAVFHLFNHAVFKSLLFVNAAAIEKETGTLDIEKMGGLSEKMPFTGATSVIALLSTAGLPPLSGFWSKLIIIMAVFQSGRAGYGSIALLASVVTLAYLLLLQRKVFFGKLADGFENVREAGPGLIIAQVLLALITVGAGLGFPLIFNTFILPVSNILR